MSDIHFVLHAQTGNVERSVEEVDTAAIVNTATSPPMPQQQQRALSQGTLHRSSEAMQQDTTQPPHVVRLGPTEGRSELLVVAGDANGANVEPRRSRRHPHRHHRHRTSSSNNSNIHRAHTASPRNSRRYSVGSVNGMGPSSPLDQQPTRPSSLLQIPSVLASQMVDGTYGNTRNQPDNNNNNNNNDNEEEEVAASAALRRRRSQDGESGARERRRRRNARPQGVRYGTSINGNGGTLHGARGGAAPNTNRNARWEAQQSMMISTIARQHYDNHGRETSSVYETPRAMPLNTRGTTHRSTQQQQPQQPQEQNGSLHTGNHHTHGNATRIGNTSTTLPAGVNGTVNTTTTGISPHPYEMYNPQYYERLRLREEVFNRAHYVLTKPPLVIAAPLLTEGPWRQSLLRSWCGSTPEGARLCRLRHLLKNMNNTITSNSNSRDEGKRSARTAQPMIAVEGGTSSHHPHNNNNNSSSNDVDVVEVEDDDTRGIGRHGGSRSHSNHRHNNNNYVHDPTNSLIEATALSLSLNRAVDGQRSGTITPPSMHAPADYLTSDSRRALPIVTNATSGVANNNSAALHTSQSAISRIHNINSSNTNNGGGGEWQLGGQTMTRTHSRASDMASEIAFYEETSALNTNNNSAARITGVGERGVSVEHRNVPRPPSLIQHNSRSTTTGGGMNNINETGSPGNTSSLLISGEARTQYILDHSVGTVGNPLSSNGSMQHASRHATQEGSTETADMIANNNNNNNGYTSGGSNGIATTAAQGAQMHNVVRNGHTADGGITNSNSSSGSSNGSEPRLLRRRNTTQPGISHVQAQPVQSPTTVAVDVSTAVMNSLTNRGEASYSREESDPTRANSEDTREAAISRAAMAPLTHKDRMRHFVRRWFCTRCTIAEQTELLAQEEKWRHYAPYALCCTCFFGDGSHYRHTMCAMCLCDIITLGIPCGCWYHGLGTALLGWRVRYLLRCRYRLRGVSIRDFCIMCCIPAAAVEQQTIELAAHGLPPCIPPNWRHME